MDHAVSQPASVRVHWSITLASPDQRSLDMTVKNNGKPLFKYLHKASGDGKTLTAVGGPLNTNEKVTVVYDRQ